MQQVEAFIQNNTVRYIYTFVVDISTMRCANFRAIK